MNLPKFNPKTMTRRDLLRVAMVLASACVSANIPLGGSTAPSGSPVFSPLSGYSITGSPVEGSLFTVTGPGVGSIGPNLHVYKNWLNEAANARGTHPPDFVGSGVTVVANGNGYAYTYAAAGLPYGQGMVLANDSRVGTVGSGGAWGGMKATYSALQSELFTSSIVYFPSGCNYSSLVSAGNPQIKDFWAYANTISDTDLYDKICNMAISLAFTTDSDTAPAIDGLAFGSNTAYAWASGPAVKQGAPITAHRWAQLNASPGSGTGNILWCQVWDGTAQTVNVNAPNLVMAASGSSNNGYNTLGIPGFVQDTSATNPNWNYQNNAFVVMGEVYVAGASSGNAGAAARVEIGDGSTYATCTRLAKCTIESPTWYSGGGAQARFRTGVFYGQSLHGLYVYVTNSANVTSPAAQIQ